MPVIIPPQILVSSSEVVLDRGPKGAPGFKQLVKNETVTAKVLRVVSDRRALLMINGRKVYAKTFLPLQPGQDIFLKVQQTGARQVLKFMGRSGDVPGVDQRILIGSFGKARPYVILSQLLDGLKPSLERGLKAPLESGLKPLLKTGGPELTERLTVLDRLTTSMGLKTGTPAAGFLQRLISGSGLLWESKLASALLQEQMPAPAAIDALVGGDLKALTLQLLSGADTLPEHLTEQLKGILNGLEQHQLLNQHLIDSVGRCLLPIPVLWPSTLKFGQLLLDLGKKKAGGSRENQVVTVSFLLSLSRLGRLRADFSVLKKGISGAFGVANEENRALVSSRLPELKQRLQAHGFTIYDISCLVLSPERLSETSLVNQAVAPSSEGMLNLVI